MAAPTYATITEITSMNDGTPAYVTDRDIIYFIGENTVIKTLDGKRTDSRRPDTRHQSPGLVSDNDHEHPCADHTG